MQKKTPPGIGEETTPQQSNDTLEGRTADPLGSHQDPLPETNSTHIQPSLESLLHSLSKEVRQGFLVSQNNQKRIQEVCEALATKMDILTQRTQILENQVAQLNEMVEKHTNDIEVLRMTGKQNTERLNVPEGVEGDNIKMFVVGLLSQCGVWEGPEDLLSQDMKRVHRDPFRKSPNAAKPRRILVNFLTYVIKEKILSRALKSGTLNASGFSFEIRSDVSWMTSNRQWELGKRLEEFRKLGATAQLKFPATLRVMRENRMHNLWDVHEADSLLEKFKKN
ncbi:hypothetical protein NDU88_001220 [Pleurodeles waltl]|uniref:L1 transposable element RRM domain-containing protein n=1 Tax=Pleurodeles waltl TaxID=8319 RepID=A0AAV7W0U3_PLEWA|nr:hypothetical protein NDU88_001220 [Pleurodeles waltl]